VTWVTDGSGPCWVEIPKKKPRKSPRAVRFAEIKVGDQIMRVWTSKGWRGGKDDFKGPAVELSQTTWYYIVTDIWFDPVAGQRNPLAGKMIAISHIIENGEPYAHKEAHTVRGLASEGFKYADRDFIAFCRERLSAMECGNVVGIGMGQVIRRRPKVAQSKL